MIRPKQHPPTPNHPPLLNTQPFRHRRRSSQSTEFIRATDHVTDETELFGTVGDGVVIEFSEVVSRIVGETRGDDGVVVDA